MKKILLFLFIVTMVLSCTKKNNTELVLAEQEKPKEEEKPVEEVKEEVKEEPKEEVKEEKKEE